MRISDLSSDVCSSDLPTASVVLRHVSPDGDSGYPGRVVATVTYTLDEAGNLGIAFEAKNDKPTVINMTNHAIFDMAGEGSGSGARGQMLTMPASHYPPVHANLLPTGGYRPAERSGFYL